MNKDNIMQIIYIVVGLIVLFIIMRVLKRTGILGKSRRVVKKEDKAKSIQDLRSMEQFNPDYKLNKTFTPIGDNAADLYAETLRKAMKGIGTDEESIYSTFSKLKCKANISEVSARYYLKFRRDLRADILDEINDKEKIILFDIINKLPQM